MESLWPFLRGGGGGVAQLVSLKAEVGAFLGSGALTHAFGMVGEAEHPWHHFGSWVVGVGGAAP